MGRKSSVKTKLPPEVLREVDAQLMRGTLTLDALLVFVRGKVHPDDAPSRSALGRYAKTFAGTARALRESREAARALAQEMGPESCEGEQGRLLVEMLRGLVFDVVYDLRSHPETRPDVEKLQRLGRTLKELSHSMHLEYDSAKRIREEERRKALAEMREKLDIATASGGLDAATAQEARRVLGFGDG